MISPHLPPPSCSVPARYTLNSLLRVVGIVFISFLSGMTAALVTIAWIAPEFSPAETLSRIERARRAGETPDANIVRDTRERMIRLYDARKKIAGLYRDDALLAEGVLLSSDGWAVFPSALTALPEYRAWEGVDWQGIPHRPQTVIGDTPRGVVFVKFDGQGFRIMPFARSEDIGEGASLWTIDNGAWLAGSVERIARVSTGATVSLLENSYRYDVLPSLLKRGILLTTEGNFAGFSEDGRIAAQGWMVEYALRSILERGAIQFYALPWRGRFVSGHLMDGAVRDVSGFYLETVGSGGSATGPRPGDVVIRVNGRTPDDPDLPRQMLFSGDAVRVTVLRNGKEMEFETEKTVVSF